MPMRVLSTQLHGPTGSATAPTYSFEGDPDSGMYSTAGGGALFFTVNGTNSAIINTSQIQMVDGSAAVTAFGFQNDIGMGMYRIADDTLGFSTAGVERMRIGSTGLITLNSAAHAAPIAVGTANAEGTAATLARSDHVHKGYGQGAWTSYPVAWTAVTTNPDIGNGSLTAGYREVGKTADIRITMRAGSTTNFGSGNWAFSLPSGMTAASAEQQVFTAIARDASAGRGYGGAGWCDASGTTIVRTHCDSISPTRSDIPFAWATSDILSIQGNIEIA